jgi:hypothetical protein
MEAVENIIETRAAREIIKILGVGFGLAVGVGILRSPVRSPGCAVRRG